MKSVTIQDRFFTTHFKEHFYNQNLFRQDIFIANFRKLFLQLLKIYYFQHFDGPHNDSDI